MTEYAVPEQSMKSWQMLVDRIAAETDEIVRRNLEIVARHVIAEVGGDLDNLMATLVAEPHYEFGGAIPRFTLDGTEDVRAMYEAATTNGDNRLEFHLSCVAADRHTVLTEGRFVQVFPGEILLQYGSAAEGEVEADRWYLTEQVSLVVWPVSEDGLIEGERVYWSEKPRVVRPVGADEYTHVGPVDRAARLGARTGYAH
jgi:hypothetical protein